MTHTDYCLSADRAGSSVAAAVAPRNPDGRVERASVADAEEQHQRLLPRRRMPRGRHRWQKPKRRRPSPAAQPPGAAATAAAPATCAAAEGELDPAFEEPAAPRKLMDFARELWRCDYRPLFAAEETAAAEVMQQEHSSYRRRLKGEAAEKYDAKWARRARSLVGHLQRLSNTRSWSFSLVARSLSFFNQRVPHRVWRDEVAERRLCSLPSCVRLLKEMQRVEPEPSFIASPFVFVVAADQTYCWQGCRKRGVTRRVAERVDAGGMPTRIRSEVYVNSLRMQVPYTLCDFSRAELAEIQEKGPYTEDFGNVFQPLQPVRIQAELGAMMLELLQLVKSAAQTAGLPPSRLSLQAIGRAVLGRPQMDPGGPTHMTWLPVLKKCNTRSHEDLRRIIEHGWLHSGLAGPLILILFGDGQTVLRARDQKRRWPEVNKGLLIGVGNFHPHAHFMFAVITAWWYCLAAACVFHLGLERVTPDMKDLEHANFVHAFTFLRVMPVAIVAYIVQDVQDPPPELFLNSPAQYAVRVQHTGGKVLLKFLEYGGSPSVWWQRSARAGRTDVAIKLHAYAFHLHRAAAFKPNCVQVSLLALFSWYAVSPKLRAVVNAFSSISLLGKLGCNQWIDRLLEYVNFLQQKRMNAFVGFDSALHNTALIKPMLHVDHAYEEAIHGAGPTEDPLTVSMINEARALRDFFRDKLGTDLTVPHAANPFWHTGNPRPLQGSNSRDQQPWDYIWRVASGLSYGVGRGMRQRWQDYVTRFIRETMFAF